MMAAPDLFGPPGPGGVRQPRDAARSTAALRAQNRRATQATAARATPPPAAEPPRPARPIVVDVLTVREVADLFRVSKMSIFRLVNSGELDSFRVGRSIRVERAAVEKYLADQA